MTTRFATTLNRASSISDITISPPSASDDDILSENEMSSWLIENILERRVALNHAMSAKLENDTLKELYFVMKIKKIICVLSGYLSCKPIFKTKYSMARTHLFSWTRFAELQPNAKSEIDTFDSVKNQLHSAPNPSSF